MLSPGSKDINWGIKAEGGGGGFLEKKIKNGNRGG